ncbi:MAG: hypothetical protein AB7V42_13655 [Thermoleophilia bacterium]
MLLAPDRAARPHDVGGPLGGTCPFCPGAEGETPPETMAVRPGGGPADSPGWLVRAFPNKFPALEPADGAHEVVVNAARHVVRLSELTDGEAARAVAAWAGRLRAIGADPRGLWPFLFLNQGASAGASLQHTHAQIIGLPFAPPSLVAREAAFAGACPICAEMADPGDGLVAREDGLVAWCPPIPGLSGTVRIAPERHAPDWADEVDAAAIGRFVRRRAAEIDRMGVEAINLWLHQRHPGGEPGFHWHLEMIARRGTLAGMELGASVIGIVHSPAELAGKLRGV